MTAPELSPKNPKRVKSKAQVGIPLKNSDGSPRDPVSILVDLGKRHPLFITVDGSAYAKVKVGAHIEVHAVHGRGFEATLAAEFHEATKGCCRLAAIKDAVVTIAAAATRSNRREAVFNRLAGDDRTVIVDRGDAAWGSYVVTQDGWTAANGHPVNFRRSRHMLELAASRNADVAALWRLISVRVEDRPLVLGWLVGALSVHGTYPILAVTGEAGSGKSTASRILKRLVDPSEPLLRPTPKDIDALRVAAIDSHVLAFDNLSGLKPEMSDALCMVSSGGALSSRTKYTDADETLIAFKRPMILNGIEGIVLRTDLSSRCIHLDLPACESHLTERELENLFLRHAGDIVAALLNGVTSALRGQDLDFGQLPRLADFAKWAAAAMPAFGYQPHDFLDAFRRNADEATTDHIEDSPFAQAVSEFAKQEGFWRGSGDELLKALRTTTGGRRMGIRWPGSPKAAIGELRRHAASLRMAGVHFDRTRIAGARLLEVAYNAPHGQGHF